MIVAINTERYEREHGKKPKGRGYWRFKLCTERVTEKDHFTSSAADVSYQQAVRAAVALATRRRCHSVVLLP